MELKEFFSNHKKVAIAFSGGVDSAYLLYSAMKFGVDAHAYYVKSPFQPEFELMDAKRLAEEISARFTILELDVLEDENIKNNPANRCYYCKRKIFSAILNAAAKDGYDVILDGTNASDDASDRPGMKAINELNVLSPLKECGLTKAQIRQLSREEGLFTWNKPAYACLATRIPAGDVISLEKLKTTEYAEGYLYSLGFRDFRVRYINGAARLEFSQEQLKKALDEREKIVCELKRYYSAVLLDLEVVR